MSDSNNSDAALTPTYPTAGTETPATSATMAATAIGPFQILRELGRGGLGEVYAARDTRLNREVALKRVRPRLQTDPVVVARFEREAEITARLQHPGIVPIYALVQEENGVPAYAMRLIDGESLASAIARYHRTKSTRTEAERHHELNVLLRAFVQVCRTIAYAHAQGVIHRDLKPENIMLGKFGEVLTVDWGLARDFEEIGSELRTPTVNVGDGVTRDTPTITEVGTTVGTPAYMSPEQFLGRNIGPATDIFALGGILFSILTNRTPNDSGADRPIEPTDYLLARRRVREIDPTISPALDAIVAHALQLAPDRRYKSASALAEDVERWLDDEPVSVFPTKRMDQLRRWGKRHPRTVIVLILFPIFLFVASIISTFLLREEQRETEAALLLAEAAARSANEQRLIAEANAERLTRHEALARRAVSQFTELGRRPSLELHPLREQWLRLAQQYYRDFLNDIRNDPTMSKLEIRALFELGQVLWNAGAWREAEPILRQCLAFSQSLEQTPANRLRSARCLVNLAVVAGKRYRIAEALNLIKQTKEILQTLDPQGDELLEESMTCRMVLAEVSRIVGRMKAAEEYASAAQEILEGILRRNPDNPTFREQYAWLLVMRATIAVNRRSYSEAKDLLQKVGEFLPKKPEDPHSRRLIARSFLETGRMHLELGELQAAQQAFEQGAALHRHLVEEIPTNSTLRLDYLRFGKELLRTALMRGDAAAAERGTALLNEQLAAMKKSDELDPAEEEVRLRTLIMQATFAAIQKKHATAMDLLDRADAIVRDVMTRSAAHAPFRKLYIEILSNRGYSALMLDRPQEAIRFLSSARAVYNNLAFELGEDLGDEDIGVAILSNRGIAAMRSNDLAAAELYLRAVITEGYHVLARDPIAVKVRIALAGASVNLGCVHDLTGRSDRAEQMYDAAYLHLKSVPEVREFADGRTFLRNVLVNRGRLRGLQKRWEPAGEDFKEAAQLVEGRERLSWQLTAATQFRKIGNPFRTMSALPSEVDSSIRDAQMIFFTGGFWYATAVELRTYCRNRFFMTSPATIAEGRAIAFFKAALQMEPELRRTIRNDPDFAPLTEHPELRPLLRNE